jgi:glycosyltransferase involved in cell wall biosynthesis
MSEQVAAPVPPRVSVVVGTRNRAAHLRDLLPSLLALRVAPGLSFEIVVVDNGSCDSTAALVRQLAGEATVPLRLVFEPEMGLSMARNRGWREARGEIVAFVDDDAVADADWLVELVAPYADPGVLGVGGRLFPRHDHRGDARSVDPAWMRVYSFDLGPTVRDARTVIGGNMSFRRAVLERLDGFDPLLGRTGRCLLAGDENDLCERARRLRPRGRIAYQPSAVMWHSMATENLTHELLLLRAYCGGISNLMIDRKRSFSARGVQRLRRAARLAVWAAHDVVRLVRRRPASLRQAVRLHECLGYVREWRGGPERACSDCSRFPDRLARLGTERRRAGQPSPGPAVSP